MKRVLLIITSILFFTTLIFSQSKVNINNLVQYGDKWFKENDDKPFTGIVFDISKETGNKILESKYVNGLLHGKYNESWDNGNKKVDGIYENGLLHGKYNEWWNNGNKKVIGTYESGMMVGNWKFYYENENIKSDGDYINGNGEKLDREFGIPRNGMNGKWTRWYVNGQKSSEGVLKSNTEGRLPVPDGKWIRWYDNGQKEIEQNYTNDEQNGLTTYWYSDGQKNFEGKYTDDKRDGLWMWWLTDGNI